MDLFGHREAPLQRRALGRPEWGVCAGSFTLQVKERVSWLFTIDRAGIASYDFNADHPKIAADDRLSNLDHREDKADRGEGRRITKWTPTPLPRRSKRSLPRLLCSGFPIVGLPLEPRECCSLHRSEE